MHTGEFNEEHYTLTAIATILIYAAIAAALTPTPRELTRQQRRRPRPRRRAPPPYEVPLRGRTDEPRLPRYPYQESEDTEETLVQTLGPYPHRPGITAEEYADQCEEDRNRTDREILEAERTPIPPGLNATEFTPEDHWDFEERSDKSY